MQQMFYLEENLINDHIMGEPPLYKKASVKKISCKFRTFRLNIKFKNSL
jgi:hypothetical protein